jgi:hypothetical protein
MYEGSPVAVMRIEEYTMIPDNNNKCIINYSK